MSLASPALLGRESRQMARPATLAAVSAILSDHATYDLLRRDILIRAAAQMFDVVVDDIEQTLLAFRNEFLRGAVSV
ncbi:hypothetical protein [Paraburkholderia sp. GAS199]|uniref:hypothetical protein n=1 Tax=Paraburkholderia sp. GAS199 TaxID=3035126 RepID=UPI003D1C6E39